jgi:hypothetical protein
MTEAKQTHNADEGRRSTEQLGLVERLRTDVLWHQRRGNETIARDCEEAANELEANSAQLLRALAALNAARAERDSLRSAIAAVHWRVARSKATLDDIAADVLADVCETVCPELRDLKA